jgi:hypothetical protein
MAPGGPAAGRGRGGKFKVRLNLHHRLNSRIEEAGHFRYLSSGWLLNSKTTVSRPHADTIHRNLPEVVESISAETYAH